MAQPAPSESRYTSERYLALWPEGVLGPDDRVELLEGVIVAMSPPNPPHDAATSMLTRALFDAIGRRAAIRVQCSFSAGPYSVPQPDVAVVPGRESDYARTHPAEALLVVEVADSSLMQDRLTKAAIYAAAGVPEYWIVNLRDDRVEVFREPDRVARSYTATSVARRGDRLTLVALAEAALAVDDLLPR